MVYKKPIDKNYISMKITSCQHAAPFPPLSVLDKPPEIYYTEIAYNINWLGGIMPDCEFLQECLFFNDKLKNMPKASDMLKKTYCKWHFNKCARHKVAIGLGKSAIPMDMYPGDIRRANEILIQYELK